MTTTTTITADATTASTSSHHHGSTTMRTSASLKNNILFTSSFTSSPAPHPDGGSSSHKNRHRNTNSSHSMGMKCGSHHAANHWRHTWTLHIHVVDHHEVYHLLFAGSIRRVTGKQLQQALEDVSGIAVKDQELLFQDLEVRASDTGASLQLEDGASLVLFYRCQDGCRRRENQREPSRHSTSSTTHNRTSEDHHNDHVVAPVAVDRVGHNSRDGHDGGRDHNNHRMTKYSTSSSFQQTPAMLPSRAPSCSLPGLSGTEREEGEEDVEEEGRRGMEEGETVGGATATTTGDAATPSDFSTIMSSSLPPPPSSPFPTPSSPDFARFLLKQRKASPTPPSLLTCSVSSGGRGTRASSFLPPTTTTTTTAPTATTIPSTFLFQLDAAPPRPPRPRSPPLWKDCAHFQDRCLSWFPPDRQDRVLQRVGGSGVSRGAAVSSSYSFSSFSPLSQFSPFRPRVWVRAMGKFTSPLMQRKVGGEEGAGAAFGRRVGVELLRGDSPRLPKTKEEGEVKKERENRFQPHEVEGFLPTTTRPHPPLLRALLHKVMPGPKEGKETAVKEEIQQEQQTFISPKTSSPSFCSSSRSTVSALDETTFLPLGPPPPPAPPAPPAAAVAPGSLPSSPSSSSVPFPTASGKEKKEEESTRIEKHPTSAREQNRNENEERLEGKVPVSEAAPPPVLLSSFVFSSTSSSLPSHSHSSYFVGAATASTSHVSSDGSFLPASSTPPTPSLS